MTSLFTSVGRFLNRKLTFRQFLVVYTVAYAAGLVAGYGLVWLIFSP